MPQLGEPTKKQRKKTRDDTREIVSAYSPEGERRNKASKRKNILVFALSIVFTLALVVLFAVFLLHS
ncbi:MAG: hypothetical protein ACI4UT_01120 [Candidatus Enteromonas sp.]